MESFEFVGSCKEVDSIRKKSLSRLLVIYIFIPFLLLRDKVKLF